MFHLRMAGAERHRIIVPWSAMALRHDEPGWIDTRDRITVALICCGLLSAFLVDMAILYFSMFRP
ncbi:hypothetical protein [Gluconacetobacter tumulisoli]|uniref:Uncharacterized protein n=1 Tax=Gluconacetobacter tumulisoli TaxID=1286189 RepID=A0A7W4K6R7_9PROT|nr:hypothetical protein [Gluconacetobacter tumulisoli]MBB2201376.1 hypothetical protein [Gluconacetobacter tumulisoli]